MNRRSVIVVALAVPSFAAYALLSGGPSARPVPAVLAAPAKVDLDPAFVGGQDLPMGLVVNESALVGQTRLKAAVSGPIIARSQYPAANHEAERSMARAAFLRGETVLAQYAGHGDSRFTPSGASEGGAS
jgi:Flp pilus assembly protein CpaB